MVPTKLLQKKSILQAFENPLSPVSHTKVASQKLACKCIGHVSQSTQETSTSHEASKSLQPRSSPE
uniref:Uncharacterized protein n=1 Tax=Rhizophora mucronata TaxID=61149 RepID=A0A2P2NZ12_RHIMU